MTNPTNDVYDQLNHELKEQVDRRLESEKSRWVRGQFDFCVIHSEHDIEEVLEFRDNFCKKYHLDGALEFDPELINIGDYFKRIDEMIKRSTVVFMFITNHFRDDDKCLLQRSDLLNRCIDEMSTLVVPVFPQKDFLGMAPSGLKGVTGLKLFSRTGDCLRITTTFNPKIRELKRLRLQEERREWEKKIVAARNRLAKRLLSEIENEKDGGDLEADCGVRDKFSNLNLTSIGSAGTVHVGHVINVIASENSNVVISPVVHSKTKIKECGDGFKVNFLSSCPSQDSE